MSKKKKQPKKKPSFAPPLSKTDKWIYKIGYVVIALLAILLSISVFRFFERIAFADDFVMASYAGGIPLSFPFIIYAFLSALIFWNRAHNFRKPIFGNPDITYGKAPWQNFYPLFSKERKRRVLRPSALNFRKKMLSLWLGGFFVCLFFACFSLFGRVSLMQNGEITVYNALNQEKQTHSVMDVSAFDIRAEQVIRRGRHRSYRDWQVRFEFETTDGSSYSFAFSDFRSREEAFEGMMKMKTLVDNRKISITGKENLDKVIDDHDYTPEEIELLYELFEVTPE